MKPNSKSTIRARKTIALALMTAALAVAGCATSSYKRGEAASASLRMAAGEVQAESRYLDVTLTSLNDLVNKPPVDLRLQYQAFIANLDQLRESAGRNEQALRRVGQSNAAYFESWDRDLAAMSFEAVRARSQERRTEVATDFDSVNRRYRETQTTVQPLLDYFQDIRKALGTDLTPAGLEAMKGSVSNVNSNAAKVQTALTKLADDLAAMSTRMSSVTVQNPQP